jgi:PAS domain S-box-containing protein
LQALRILLVDDDQDYCILTKRLLNQLYQNIEFEWVGTYQEGLSKVLEQVHDVYLIDFQLGQESGLDLVREAIRQGVEQPLVVVTGHGHRDTGLAALRAGATDYVEKVLTHPSILQRAIDHAILRADAFRKQRVRIELYRSLIEENLDSIIVSDPSGQVIYANSAALSLLGVRQEKLLKRSIFDIIQIANSETSLMEIGNITGVHGALERPDGAVRQIEISIRQIQDRFCQFIIRDTSQHQRSIERRDRHIERLTILHQIDDELSLIQNIDAVLALAIDASVRLSGATAGYLALSIPEAETDTLYIKELIGKTTSVEIGDVVPPTPLLEDLLSSGEACLSTDLNGSACMPPVSPDSTAQMLLPLTSHEQVLGILHLETHRADLFNREVFDFLKLITTRIAIAVENAQLYQIAQSQLEELKALYTRVSGLEQLKSDMIRIAAHDLGNPLNVITTAMLLLERAQVQDNQIEYFDQIKRASEQMKTIISEILSLERIEQMQDSPGELLDLCELAAEAVKSFKAQARGKSQSLSLDTSEPHLTIQADPAQLREAIANLISNAIKYTPEQGTIRVIVQREDDMVALRVEDNGYGITEDQQQKLFQPFFRAKSPETHEIEGNGLGLYLIKNIVDRFKGSVVFESVYGEGSTFGFRLPEALAVSVEH